MPDAAGSAGGSRTAPTLVTGLACGDDLGHEAAQEAAGVRFFDAGDLFGGSCRDDLASRVSAFGTEVDNVVCGPDHV